MLASGVCASLRSRGTECYRNPGLPCAIAGWHGPIAHGAFATRLRARHGQCNAATRRGAAGLCEGGVCLPAEGTIVMKHRSKMAGSAFATLAVCILLGVGSGCGSAESAEPSGVQSTTDEVTESLSTDIDQQTTARATRSRSGLIRVAIAGSDGKLQFVAEYRSVSANKYRVDYTLYPVAASSGAEPRPESSAIELQLQQIPALEDAVMGAVVIRSQFESAVLGNYDSWGCDLLPARYNWIASCGLKGRCCDIHDACYRQNGCTSGSWTSAPWNRCQYRCNAPAVACFIGQNPGPSECCWRGNCGQPR
jgi:hypothetical protein